MLCIGREVIHKICDTFPFFTWEFGSFNVLQLVILQKSRLLIPIVDWDHQLTICRSKPSLSRKFCFLEGWGHMDCLSLLRLENQYPQDFYTDHDRWQFTNNPKRTYIQSCSSIVSIQDFNSARWNPKIRSKAPWITFFQLLFSQEIVDQPVNTFINVICPLHCITKINTTYYLKPLTLVIPGLVDCLLNRWGE